MRAEILQSGCMWHAALQRSAAKLGDATLWAHLPPTEAQASMLFKVFLRIQSCIYDFLAARYRCWPLRLCDLLLWPQKDSADHDLALAEFLSAPSCLLDEMSQHIRDTFPSPRLLSSQACQVQIHVLMLQISGSTYDTERLHSRSGRSQKSRYMTHTLATEDMAVAHTAAGGPQTASIFLQADQRHSGKRSKAMGGAAGAAKPAPRRGGGGPCRAFLHSLAIQQCEQSGRFSMAKAQAAYRELSAEQKARFAEMGRAGTVQHRLGNASFGPTHRDRSLGSRMGSWSSRVAAAELSGGLLISSQCPGRKEVLVYWTSPFFGGGPGPQLYLLDRSGLQSVTTQTQNCDFLTVSLLSTTAPAFDVEASG